jgi:hypothetical protein
VKKGRNTAVPQLGDITIKGGGGGFSALPAKATSGAAPGGFGGPS